MQQTMVRVKDPETSLKFYIETLGFQLVMFRLPAVGLLGLLRGARPDGTGPRGRGRALGLLHADAGLHRTDLEPRLGEERRRGLQHGQRRRDGHEGRRGREGRFGHLGITVPDVYEARERFKKLGCTFTETPNSGRRGPSS